MALVVSGAQVQQTEPLEASNSNTIRGLANPQYVCGSLLHNQLCIGLPAEGKKACNGPLGFTRRFVHERHRKPVMPPLLLSPPPDTHTHTRNISHYIAINNIYIYIYIYVFIYIYIRRAAIKIHPVPALVAPASLSFGSEPMVTEVPLSRAG